MTNENLYKVFRNVKNDSLSLQKRFDEPTYFSFRLVFGDPLDAIYNYAGSQALYDTMPHPLFNDQTGILNIAGTNTTFTVSDDAVYSSLKYLQNANEPTRAAMLKDFIAKFNELQYNYPYYFQTVEGIPDMLKIDPTKGQRIANDRKLNITCLEGLDLRMSYLLNLYRKIVWDDVYQRWVLPDMMRYFTLKIYLAEFRTFHEAQISQNTGEAGPTEQVGAAPMYLTILDKYFPTWEITCEMCEFDLTDISFEHLTNLSIATDPQQGAVKFGIKVGNIKEIQTYPVFENMFLIDRKLNGPNRAKDAISTSGEDNNSYLYPASLQIAQHRGPSTPENRHVSGRPFVERANEDNTNEADIIQEQVGGTFDVNFNATQPNTWAGNAIKFGKSYAEDFVNKLIDKGKVTPIPGLGVSFNEVKTAIESKNIISALGMIRKGVNEVVNQYGNAPSSKLDQPIQTDKILSAFLLELTKSEATDNDTVLLKGMASMALNNRGIWEKIKDYSLATNLVGPGEVNTLKTIDSNTGKSMHAEKFKATTNKLEVGSILELAPSSQATNSKLQ